MLVGLGNNIRRFGDMGKQGKELTGKDPPLAEVIVKVASYTIS